MKHILLYFSVIIVLISNPLRSQDTLTVFSNPYIKPYSDTETGIGLSKITLAALFSNSNFVMNYSGVNDPAMINDSTSPNILIGLTEENSQFRDIPNSLFIPIYYSSYVLLSKNGSKVEKLSDISEKRVGLLGYSFAESKIRQELMFYTKYNSSKDAINALLSDNIDYLLTEKAVAKYFLKLKDFGKTLSISKQDVFPVNVGFLAASKDKSTLGKVDRFISSYKNSSKYKSILEEYYTLPTDSTYITIILIVVGVVLLSIIVLVLKKRYNIKLSDYGKLSMNGMIIFRVSPAYYNKTDDNSENDFKKKLNEMHLNYSEVNFKYDYSGSAVRINVSTPRKIFLSDISYINRFTDELSNTIKELPNEKYLIDVNITGNISGIKNNYSFLIVNNKNKIGIHMDEKKNIQFPIN